MVVVKKVVKAAMDLLTADKMLLPIKWLKFEIPLERKHLQVPTALFLFKKAKNVEVYTFFIFLLHKARS